MSRKTIQVLGEFGLINQIKKWVPQRKVVSGIGDDAAVFKTAGGSNQLLTIDSLVENVDFIRKKASPSQIGWKALGINLSDIAAMGGVPKVAVVSLILPKRTSVDFVKGFYAGIKKLANRFDVSIVGGDLSSGPKIAVSVALLGQSHPKKTVLRSGAKIGDFICVSGRLGGSILKKHLTFMPRIKEGQFLAKEGVHAMIDVSDGLKQDLKHISDESKVGAVLDERKVPVSGDALRLAGGNKRKALEHALTDGEDFELLFTIAQDQFHRLERKFKKHFSTPLTQIGRIVDPKNATLEMRKRLGFQHF